MIIVDMSNPSIEMLFEPIPSLYLNQVEEFEDKKSVEEDVQVHGVCDIDDDPVYG